VDINTMVLALALGNISLCAALFFYDFSVRKPPALATWSAGRQCQAVAWLLLCLRAAGIAPDVLALPLGYALLFTGVALEGGALWQAAERTHWRRPTYLALGLAIGVFLVCYWIDARIDATALRVVACALMLGAFYLVCAAALASGWRSASMLRRFLAVAVAVLALAVASRGAITLVMPGGWGWLSNTIVQSVSSAALFLLMLLVGFGYLLLGREQLQSELTRLAVVDPLTDVPNRRGFFSALAPWMALARRPGLPTSLIMFDLDQFKRVNDSYGHPAGDTVLRSVVDTCKRQLRDSDQLGRLVGVEFAVLLPRTALPEAVLVAERMRAAIAASPVKSERAVVAMTASFGVTTIRADDSTVSLFKRVDEALRTAKLAGRNRIVEAALPVALEA
jgi:diguanylate cyclase (GGDEF)-like protein